MTIEEIEQKLLFHQKEHQVAKKQLEASQKTLQEAQEKESQAYEKFRSEGGKIAGERSHLEAQLRYSTESASSQRQAMSELAAEFLPLILISPLLSQAQTQGQKESRQQQAKIALDVLRQRDQRFLNCIAELALLPEQIDKIKSFIE